MIFKKLIAAAGLLGTLGAATPAFAHCWGDDDYAPPAPVVTPYDQGYGYGYGSAYAPSYGYGYAAPAWQYRAAWRPWYSGYARPCWHHGWRRWW